MVFSIKTSVLVHNYNDKISSDIPRKYTRKGDNVSPPLEWVDTPPNTKSLALVVDDPDAPDPAAPKMTWVHWILYNIPPFVSSFPEGVTKENLPGGTREGLNDWKKTGYDGPSPPRGRHRYFFKLYALDTVLNFTQPPTKKKLEAAMKRHIIAKAEFVGTYHRATY